MRKTLKEWDDRLAATPPNAPARLLEALPQANDRVTSRKRLMSSPVLNRAGETRT